MERGEVNYLPKDWEELSKARNLAFKEGLVYESRLAEWLFEGLKFKGQQWEGHPFSTDDVLHFSGCRDRSAIDKRHKDAAMEAYSASLTPLGRSSSLCCGGSSTPLSEQELAICSAYRVRSHSHGRN